MIITLKGCTATAFIGGLNFFKVSRGTVSGASVTIATSTINKDEATSTSAREIATVALNSNYENLVVTVTMGGTTVNWFANGKVTIPANTTVTGDIKISASATAIVPDVVEPDQPENPSTGGGETINLLTLGTSNVNTKLGSTNSTPTSGTGYTVYTDIPITGGNIYSFAYIYRSWWKDKNKNDISSFNPGSSSNVVAPPNAAYVSVTTYSEDTTNIPSITLYYDVSSDEIPDGENIITLGTLNEGKSLSSVSYTMTINADYYVYDQIPVESGGIYKLNAGSVRSWWLDANKNGLSTVNLAASNCLAVVPTNAAYLSVTINTATTTIDNAYMIKIL